MNYEENISKLENILSKLESPDITLSEMMDNYKEAIELYNGVEKYLENYKQEIKKVTEDGLANLDTEDIEDEIDDEK